jgi:hypothetical protein
MRVRELSSRRVTPSSTGDEGSRAVSRVWPRERATAVALTVLLFVQVLLFFVVTQRSFFFADDYNYFKLAEERSFILYLLTPVLGVYPAPGDRLASFLLQKAFPMNFIAARLILLAFLAAATILLCQLVRTFARSERWWTVVLLVPFALSVTLVVPFSWWSAGIPILPSLAFTLLALVAWLRSYTDPRSTFWLGVAVVAVAAAGAFYIKFLLIPVYLLFVRLAILPRILQVPGGIRSVWDERIRWVALGAPPALFLAVYYLSGLAGRSAVEGSRPYLEYFTTAWFRAVIPAAFMNARLVGSGPSIPAWVIVASSQAIFWVVVAATWIRSSLAARGWALFAFVFLVNVAVVGTVRLPAFGAQIAYDLRYYPEIALFLPMALALALRRGEERKPHLAWERSAIGGSVMVAMAAGFVASFVAWAPGIVTDSPGVPTRSWYQNLRDDLDALTTDEGVPRIVDSETPTYVMPGWMATDNRVSTILQLADVEVVYNELSAGTFLVRSDGRLAEAAFDPIQTLALGSTLGDGVRIESAVPARSTGSCIGEGARLIYRPGTAVTGGRLGLRVLYSTRGRGPVRVVVDAGDPERRFRYLELRPADRDGELIDLGTTGVRSLAVNTSAGDRVCIGRLELGSLTAGGD